MSGRTGHHPRPVRTGSRTSVRTDVRKSASPSIRRDHLVRLVHLSPSTVIVDVAPGQLRTTGTTDGMLSDLPTLLARISRVAGDSVTLLLAHGAHVELGFPDELPKEEVTDGEVISACKRAGWILSGYRPWMTLWGRNHETRFHVGILPWITPHNFPLADPTSTETTLIRMLRYSDLVGLPPWGRTQGTTGTQLLRKMYSGPEPRWLGGDYRGCGALEKPCENAAQWDSPHVPDGEFDHGYDVNLQYLTAAGSARLGLDILAPTEYQGPTTKHAAGFYRIVVPAWNIEELPPPFGTLTPGAEAWVTGPTLDLVCDLADDTGYITAPDVLECWTSHRTSEFAKNWTKKLRDAVEGAREFHDPVLIGAVKATYRAGIGLMDKRHGGNRIFRPDWAATIRAHARGLLWRKVWTQYLTDGRTPTRVAADAVFYKSDQADPMHPDSWPSTFTKPDPAKPHAANLGGFRPYVKGDDK